MIDQKPVRSAVSAVATASKHAHGSPSVHLEALRGFAAFSVLLGHCRNFLFLPRLELVHHNPLLDIAYLISGLGPQWVIVFFVLSGYLVGGSVLRSVATGRWSWRGYLFTRLTRLYAVLLPALLLGGILDCAGMHLVDMQAHYAILTLDPRMHVDLTFPTLAANCLFLQNIKLPDIVGNSFPVYGTNIPLWSLCNEFWYYLAFPLLVLLLAKGRSWRVRVACGLCLLVWELFVGSGIALAGIPWLMGVLITYLPPFPARGNWTRRIAIGTALVLLAIGLVVAARTQHQFGWISDALLGLIVTFLIWVTLHCATKPLPTLYVKVAQRSARSSYTLYLTHFPLLIFLRASLHLPRTVPSWHLFLIAVCVLSVVVLYSQLVYELFEKNTDRMRKCIKHFVMRETAIQ